MFKGQKVVVVMPAYNADQTLKKTYDGGGVKKWWKFNLIYSPN